MTQGKTVRLRSPEVSDADVLFDWHAEDYLRSRVGNRYPRTREGWREFVALFKNESFGDLLFMVDDIESSRPLGIVVLQDVSPEDRHAEVVIMVGEKTSRGQGAGGEATLLMSRFAFDVMGLRRVYGFCLANNPAAVQGSKNIGFTQEGVLREHVLVDGEYVDLVQVGMMADELPRERLA